jgi:putative transposase
VVAVGNAHHITQRGIARQPVFHSDHARNTYLQLLCENARRHQLRILGYCLMTNHVHLLAIPEHRDAMARTIRFVHGQFAQYTNTALGRSGHFWQNRFYSCPVEDRAVSRVLAYIELNPVRAGLCRHPAEFRWSSAAIHLGTRSDEQTLLDLEWWRGIWTPNEWETALDRNSLPHETLRQATRTGRPFGSEEFVADLELRLRRKLDPQKGGRPKKLGSAALKGQNALFV